jgi:hypothetical protein
MDLLTDPKICRARAQAVADLIAAGRGPQGPLYEVQLAWTRIAEALEDAAAKKLDVGRHAPLARSSRSAPRLHDGPRQRDDSLPAELGSRAA